VAPAGGSSIASRRRSIALVSACTVFGAAAQILIKVGVARFVIPERHDWISWLIALAMAFVTDLPLFSGYALYGLNTLLLVLALREGELSMLYPIIALTYVWVTLLSYALLPEKPNWYKNVGITVIVIGVAVLGRGKPRVEGQQSAIKERA
jgi:multidrug transporter EmrE-like cation transporter